MSNHTPYPRPVTVSFDAEDAIDTLRALQSVICPENLVVVGSALVIAARKENQ